MIAYLRGPVHYPGSFAASGSICYVIHSPARVREAWDAEGGPLNCEGRQRMPCKTKGGVRMRCRRAILNPALLAAAYCALCLTAELALAGGSHEREQEFARPAFDKQAWAFSTPERPDVPEVRHEDAVKNPIDAFLLSRLETADLAFSRPAGKLVLLRRLTTGLTGLPPTRSEIDAFLADDSPQAYRHVVERLLASPHYGEKQAQHWLDLVRFAETEGFKADSHRPDAYKYRDYVIRAFNSDLPYDRFVRQQIAGDELEPENAESLVATGLNRLFPDENNAANLFQRRDEILTDIVDTNSMALMALTMGCARCHDHKFDAISQVDYYRLRAFFEPLVQREKVMAATPMHRKLHARQQAAWEEATDDIRREMAELLKQPRKNSDSYTITKFRQEIRDCVSIAGSQRSPLEQQIAEMAQRQLDARFSPHSAMKKQAEAVQEQYFALEEQLAAFDYLKPVPLPTVMAAVDVGGVAPATHRLEGGNWRTPAERLAPGFPALFGAAEPSEPAAASQSSTGRRVAFAAWLTRPDHPLTARVIVNRLWQQHFGRGIVATPNDFGAMGAEPTHPELLDWLAVELIENRWSLKHIHRLIVSSRAYRQSSELEEVAVHQAAAEVDPENGLLWRARRRRLDGEALRDAMLVVSGQMNRQMYGESVKPELPAAIGPRYRWEESSSWQQRRRSIYVLAKRNMRYPFFDAFDLPDMHNSCACREETTTAPQALITLNGELPLELSAEWARRLMEEHEADARSLIESAYLSAFARVPLPDEIEAAEAFLTGGGEIGQGRVESFVHALFNSNEFIFVD